MLSWLTQKKIKVLEKRCINRIICFIFVGEINAVKPLNFAAFECTSDHSEKGALNPTLRITLIDQDKSFDNCTLKVELVAFKCV